MILVREYYWRKIELVDNEKEEEHAGRLQEIDPRNYCWRDGWEDRGRWASNFHASLHDDRVMKIAGSTGDYSNETSNKIPANQPP